MKSLVSYVTRSTFTVVTAAVVGVLFVVGLVSAATTISTNISTGGTLSVTGASTLAAASTTLLSANFAQFGGTGTTTVTTAGWLGVGTTSPTTELGVTGTTTSSAGARIGAVGSGITQLLFGTCAVDFPNAVASTTVVANCTATGVSTLDKVFVTPASTTDFMIITGASSTGSNTIQISAFNLGTQGGAGAAVNMDTKIYSWMAVR